MRESRKHKSFVEKTQGEGTAKQRKELPCDEASFFESFYRANVEGEPEDWMTIGQVSEPEARFHYNATENSIIRALCKLDPPPAEAMTRAWRMVKKRERKRLVDVGSGTGHWIDFMREVFFFSDCVGIELAEQMVAYLEEKYQADEGIVILKEDVASDRFDPQMIGDPVDVVTAIGVMFHIVDDGRWEKAVENLTSLLKPGGLILAGGEFGAETRNVQFHSTDQFESWREFASAKGETDQVRVNKRVRSLSDWSRLGGRLGLTIVDVVRSQSDPNLTTPENDLLVLRKEG